MLDFNSNQDTSFEVDFGGQGTWWHPNSPGLTVSGVLSFSWVDGASLDTAAALQVPFGFEFNAVICGEIDDVKYTLNACFRTRIADLTAGPLSRETWVSTTVFKGAHLVDGADTDFHRINFKTKLLSKWVFKPQPRIGSISSGGKIEGSITIPNQIDMKIDSHTSVTLAWLPHTSQQLLHAFAIVTPQIEITTKPKTLYDIHDNLISPILYLISFCLGAADRVTSLSLNFYDSVQGCDGTVEVFQERSNFSKENNVPRFPQEYLIQFSEVESYLENFFVKWFSIYHGSESTFLDYFASFFNDYLYSDEKFLRILRSLESWHADHSGSISKDKFEVKRILKLLSKNLKKKEVRLLVSKMSQYGKPSLRERLDDMLASAAPNLRNFLLTKTNFSALCVSTRNKYTHHLTKNNYFKGAELFWAEQYLRALFANLILVGLGFSEAEIERNLHRSRLGQLIRLPDPRP